MCCGYLKKNIQLYLYKAVGYIYIYMFHSELPPSVLMICACRLISVELLYELLLFTSEQTQESYQQQKARRLLAKSNWPRGEKREKICEKLEPATKKKEKKKVSLKSHEYKAVLQYCHAMPGIRFSSKEQQSAGLTSTINVISAQWDMENHETLNGRDWLCRPAHWLEADALYCWVQREACGDTADTVTPYLTLGVKSKGSEVMRFPDHFKPPSCILALF